MTDIPIQKKFILIPYDNAIERIEPTLSLRRSVVIYDVLSTLSVPTGNGMRNQFLGCTFCNGAFVIVQHLDRRSLIFAVLANEVYIICFKDQLNTELLVCLNLLLMLNDVAAIVIVTDKSQRNEYESLWKRTTFSEKHIYKLSIEVKVF